MGKLSRIYRLVQLMGVLQSGRVHNADQLADLCEVSQRTIFRDLHVLQMSGIPVEYNAAQQGYYVPSSFFLPSTNFTPEESLSLIVLCYELGSEHGLPFYEQARAAALKLDSNLPGSLRETISWHKTHQLHWNRDGTLELRVNVDGFNEMSRWILGYGDQVEVLKPSRLRDLIQARIAAMGEIYRRAEKPRRVSGSRKKTVRSHSRQPRGRSSSR